MLNNLNIWNSFTDVLIKFETLAEIKMKKYLKVPYNKRALQYEK